VWRLDRWGAVAPELMALKVGFVFLTEAFEKGISR
jgi:hypothetical protein